MYRYFRSYRLSLTQCTHFFQTISSFVSSNRDICRSILTVPWSEMGGKVQVTCPQTDYTSTLIFHTKVFIVCLFVRLSVFLSVCLSVFLSVCLFVCFSVCLSVCSSVCFSVCLSVCLFFCLFVCLPVCLSVCLSVYYLHC